jgi:hypothetical protein
MITSPFDGYVTRVHLGDPDPNPYRDKLQTEALRAKAKAALADLFGLHRNCPCRMQSLLTRTADAAHRRSAMHQ